MVDVGQISNGICLKCPVAVKPYGLGIENEKKAAPESGFYIG